MMFTELLRFSNQGYITKDGTSLAMYPLVGFAFQAQGYVSKGRRFLSDAPVGRFPSPWPAAFRKSVADFCSIFLLKFLSKTSVSVDLSHSWFWVPCRYTLSRLRKYQNGASLAMYPLVGFASLHQDGLHF